MLNLGLIKTRVFAIVASFGLQKHAWRSILFLVRIRGCETRTTLPHLDALFKMITNSNSRLPQRMTFWVHLRSKSKLQSMEQYWTDHQQIQRCSKCLHFPV